MKWTLWKRLLVAFVALGVMPMVLVSYFVDREATASLQSGVIASLLEIANQKVAYIESYVREREGDVQILSSQPALIDVLEARSSRGSDAAGSPQAARRLLESYVQVYGYHDAMLVAKEGAVLIRLRGGGSIAGGADAAQDVAIELVDTLRTLGQTGMIDYFDPRTNRRMAWIGAPIIANGGTTGFVVLQIAFDRLFASVTSQSGSGHTEETLLVSTSGSEIEFVTPPRLRGAADPRVHMGDARGVAAQRAVSGAKGSGFTVDYRGVAVAAVYRHIPSLGWGVVVKLDRAEAFAPIYRLRAAAATIAVAALLLLVLIGWLIAWSITRPLAHLQRAVERVADGNFDHVAINAPGEDEVGRLARAFNQMVVKLQQSSELTAEKHRLEAELREREVVEQLRAQLARSEQLAALGRVATAMAHEFNNVLMSVQSLNDATRRVGTFEQFSKTLPMIDRAVARGKRITGEVRTLGRASTAALVPVQVGGWLEQLAAELRSLLEATVELTVTADPDVGYMWADPEQLKQVFVNLALNARDAMNGSGHLSVWAARHSGPDAAQVELLVCDSGGGIDPAVLDKIFEPLFTTKRDGAGLGLAVAHAIVQAHGGQITAESVLGTGTTFRVALPGAPQPEAEPPVTAAPLIRNTAHRLLLVEDDETVAAGITVLLELEGYRVTQVASAAAALEELRTLTPDVLLLDIRLGDEDGIALYSEIEAVLRPFPVVFASGHGDQRQLGEYANHPHVMFIAKPFAIEELLVALAHVTSSGPAAELLRPTIDVRRTRG